MHVNNFQHSSLTLQRVDQTERIMRVTGESTHQGATDEAAQRMEGSEEDESSESSNDSEGYKDGGGKTKQNEGDAEKSDKEDEEQTQQKITSASDSHGSESVSDSDESEESDPVQHSSGRKRKSHELSESAEESRDTDETVRSAPGNRGKRRRNSVSAAEHKKRPKNIGKMLGKWKKKLMCDPVVDRIVLVEYEEQPQTSISRERVFVPPFPFYN